MADVLVDTDILIDVARKIPDAITYVQNLEQQAILGISSITYMELLIGCRNKTEQRKVERFVRRFQVVKVNEMIADRTIVLLQQYRLSHGLLIADGLIAATALVVDKPSLPKTSAITGLLPALPSCPTPKTDGSARVCRQSARSAFLAFRSDKNVVPICECRIFQPPADA